MENNQGIKNNRLQDIANQIKNRKEDTRICKYCNDKFVPTSNLKSFCSNECRVYYQYNKMKSKTILCRRKCAICCKTFFPKFNTQLYCSAECAILGERQKNDYDEMFQKIIPSETKKIKRFKLSNKFRKGKVHIKEITITCKYCGTKFISNSILQRYCTSECSEKQKQESFEKENGNVSLTNKLGLEKTCKYCGKSFIMESQGDSEFCSLKCKNSYARGKLSKDTNNQLKEVIRIKVTNLIEKGREPISEFNGRDINYWEIPFPLSLREKILERDNYTCQVCTSGHNLHVHHIRPRIRGGAHIEDNLITLCGKCHCHIETRDIEHATNKCYRNYINVLKNKEIRPLRINKDELISQLRDNLEYVLEKISALDYDETREIAKEIDNFLDENYKF